MTAKARPQVRENEWTGVRISRETGDMINSLSNDLGNGVKMTNGVMVHRMVMLFDAAVAEGLLDTDKGFLFFYGKEGYEKQIAPLLVAAIRAGIPESDRELLPGAALRKLSENQKPGPVQHFVSGSV